MAAQWTCGSVLNWTRQHFEKLGDPHPRVTAEWLLSAVTGKSRIELYLSFDEPMTKPELDAMHAAIERRMAGEPLQYVTGEMPFRHIILKCEPGVLIPRPETEILVDEVLAVLGKMEAADPDAEKFRVLEIGTGTGCIALSIAQEDPKTAVVATDISQDAIRLAKRNREALGLEEAVDIVECDLVSGLDPEDEGAFSVVVSNPPYIPSSVMPQLPSEVAHFEPELALDGGADGLDVFRRILAEATPFLAPGGLLATELYEGHLDTAAELARETGLFSDVSVVNDLNNKPRVLLARKKAE
jgi:release factor glutamine methyltransferase